jgi:hypothetical protein
VNRRRRITLDQESAQTWYWSIDELAEDTGDPNPWSGESRSPKLHIAHGRASSSASALLAAQKFIRNVVNTPLESAFLTMADVEESP